MPTAPVPPWLPALIFTDPLGHPPAYRFDLVPGGTTVAKTVVMQRARARVHSTLPPVDVWTYDGSYPGPTFVARRGQVVQVTWVNGIRGGYPARVILAPDPGVTGNRQPQNEPGDSCGTEVMGVPEAARTVVHLHGGQTQADSDGWPDNVLAHGHATVSRYEVGQQAAMIWYHDHAMGITRYNVYAGLAGLWVIRDDEEEDLIEQGRLPDRDHELFLAIQDRNLATVDGMSAGAPTCQFLHKIDEGTGEFFGPFTLVNGTIWPRHPVRPRTYRVRVLNASNARAYGLELRYVGADNMPTTDTVPAGAVVQVGTDGGLLPAAWPIEAETGRLGPLVVLAPAERVDLLIDFGKLAGGAGCRVAWFNTANAPYNGGYLAPDHWDQQTADREDSRLTQPQVIRFDIEPGPIAPSLPTTGPLSAKYRRLGRADAGMKPFRLSALVELPDPADPNGATMLFLRELFEATPGDPGCHATRGGPMPVELDAMSMPRTYQITMPGEPSPRTYFVAAEDFYDTINWLVNLGDTEEWRFLNLTPDVHPMHVHLVQFQLIDRTTYMLEGHSRDAIIDKKSLDECGFPKHSEAILPVDGPVAPPDGSADLGWKDTIRVQPSEMLAIVARFGPFSGRYMYHCHVVEHEDRVMMRPFVVGTMSDMKMRGMPASGGMPGMSGGHPGSTSK